MNMPKATLSLVDWRDMGSRAVGTFIPAAMSDLVATLTNTDIS